ncbi:hypothetical protein SESBI_06471 [Sesbania bispinosa]|nr:hypothetical protein SESBI_06471 [Sesbania bispinosa]
MDLRGEIRVNQKIGRKDWVSDCLVTRSEVGKGNIDVSYYDQATAFCPKVGWFLYLSECVQGYQHFKGFVPIASIPLSAYPTNRDK